MRIYSCHCYKEPYKIEIIIAHFADEDTKVYTICVCVCVCVLYAQSCPTLCDPTDCSPPGSSAHEMF